MLSLLTVDWSALSNIFFFKQKTVYEIRISDWSSDVCSSDLMSSGELHVPASLVAETDHPAPGQTVTLAFTMKPQAGWHGYWENPGDAGKGMTLKWDLPSGVTVSALRYPVPETLLISGLMNYVYEDDYAPLVTLTVPPNFAPGDRLPIRVRADWLYCTHEICVPEGEDRKSTRLNYSH